MTTKTEAGLQPNEPRTVTGVKGIKSKDFRRTFRNEAAMERWLTANEGDVEVHSIERAN